MRSSTIHHSDTYRPAVPDVGFDHPTKSMTIPGRRPGERSTIHQVGRLCPPGSVPIRRRTVGIAVSETGPRRRFAITKATVNPRAENAIGGYRRGSDFPARLCWPFFICLHPVAAPCPVLYPRTRRIRAIDAGRPDDGRRHVRNALKARFDAVQRLAQLLRATRAVFPASPKPSFLAAFTSSNWWPADLGVSGAATALRTMRAMPSSRVLAGCHPDPRRDKIFDTGEHHIGGLHNSRAAIRLGDPSPASCHLRVIQSSELVHKACGRTPAYAAILATPCASTVNPAPRSHLRRKHRPVSRRVPGDPASIVAGLESLRACSSRHPL